MEIRLIVPALIGIVALAATGNAADRRSSDKGRPAEKKAVATTPADKEGEQFYKLRQAAAAKPDKAGIDKMLIAGLDWVMKYPTDPRAPGVVRDLGNFNLQLKDKALRPLREAYTAQVEFEIVSRKFKAGTTDEAKLALAAIITGLADADARLNFNRQTLATLREKIDELANQPKPDVYLLAAEQSYLDLIIRAVNKAAGEKQMRALMESPNKAIAEWANANYSRLFEAKESAGAEVTPTAAKGS